MRSYVVRIKRMCNMIQRLEAQNLELQEKRGLVKSELATKNKSSPYFYKDRLLENDCNSSAIFCPLGKELEVPERKGDLNL